VYRDLLLKAAESDTFYSELFDGGWPNAPHRVLRNTTVENWLAAGCPAPGERPGEGEVIATSPPKREFVRYGSDTPLTDTQGAIEALSLWAGQGVALVRQSQTAKEIVIEIAEQARTAIHQLAELQ
jgi:NAD(P)H-dependent flavin oxidoreductase YrpB (nitropropane dioxygenase family)